MNLKVSNTVAITMDGEKLLESFEEMQKEGFKNPFEEEETYVPSRKIIVQPVVNTEIKYPIDELYEPSNANHKIRGGMTRIDIEELGKKILALLPFLNRQG
jgi:hypothetical protein